MRPLLFALIFATGCCTVQRHDVEQSRRNYNTLAPRIHKMLKTSTYSKEQRQDIRDRLTAWDLRISKKEKALND